MKKDKYIILAEFAIIFATAIFLFLVVQAVMQTGWSWFIDFKYAANWGSVIAGALSFFTAILLYLTLKHQTDSFSINQFENKYFEQIKYHREIVAMLTYESPESKDKSNLKIVSGIAVFNEIHNQLLKAIEILDKFVTEKQIAQVYLNSDVYQSEIDLTRNDYRNIDITEFTKLNIAYQVVYYGVSEQGKAILIKILNNKYNPHLINDVLDAFSSIPVCSSMYRRYFSRGSNLPANARYYKYFGGHQHRLGHYFRNLYQTVTYIDRKKELGFDEKYEYVRRLRAQFSTYEQSVFFFNSISFLGRNWEFKHDKLNEQLVTKYNLIKNIPAEFITDIDIRNYYPLIQFENTKPNKARMKIVHVFK